MTTPTFARKQPRRAPDAAPRATEHSCPEQAPSILSTDREGWWIGSGLPDEGRPLPPGLEAGYAAALGSPLRGVRLHDDPGAAAAASRLGARAFTLGHDVYFGAGEYQPHTATGNRLLAHELAHVVQQRAVDAPPGTRVGAASAAQEAEARGAADAVSRGERPHPIAPATAPALAMQAAAEVPTASNAGANVLEALRRPDPVAGVGDPAAALAILSALTGDELVAAVIDVDDEFMLSVLINALAATDQSEAAAVIYAVRVTSPHSAPDDQYTIRAARGLARLPVADQDRILARVLARRSGTSVDVAAMREGMMALDESEAALTAEGFDEVDADAVGGVAATLAGVVMGPWNPGRMPIPFYIGNSAHVAIAAAYAGLHPADAAFYNFSPISAILAAARALSITVNPAAITAAQLGLKPDIANVTRRHLYEIKPATAQSLGAAEARLYVVAFTAAGLPLALGPVGEAGTSGTLPGPGGWFTYSAPEPGVITYRYRQPRRRRVRVTSPSQSPAVDRSLVERIALATGLTGTALVIYLIISEGSRVVFPPRNLIPVP
jgi:hypothetical protein